MISTTASLYFFPILGLFFFFYCVSPCIVHTCIQDSFLLLPKTNLSQLTPQTPKPAGPEQIYTLTILFFFSTHPSYSTLHHFQSLINHPPNKSSSIFSPSSPEQKSDIREPFIFIIFFSAFALTENSNPTYTKGFYCCPTCFDQPSFFSSL